VTFADRLAQLGRFKWAPHNVVAHPLSELLFHVGARRASHWLHDITVPTHAPGEGRG
jgi:hypothetical protein